MKKLVVVLASLVMIVGLFAGCTTNTPKTTPTTAPAVTTTAPAGTTAAPTADTVATASIATDDASLTKAVGPTGTWLVAIKGDLTVTSDVVVDGAFTNENTKAPGRILGFYNQDKQGVRTATYTLTAPKMTIKSANTILKGNFTGDIYVDVPNFSLEGSTVTGNIYFIDAAAQSSFKPDAASKVTGTQTLKK
ncbi:MAG: hypothetical protein WCL54_02995 [Clostridia bacterium]